MPRHREHCRRGRMEGRVVIYALNFLLMEIRERRLIRLGSLWKALGLTKLTPGV